jgi:putative hydrolase of HD superfamily
LEKERLDKQISFLLEIDKLKTILRRSYLTKGNRRENSAEHSWHLGVMAILLAEYSNRPVDMIKLLKMVLIHDIVEIDAGDTYCYDNSAHSYKYEREKKAADRIFGMLPPEQAEDFRKLWEEFEAAETPESKFAAVLDRLMPLLHNYHTYGRSWKEHGITKGQVFERNTHIHEGSFILRKYIHDLIENAISNGYLSENDT